MRLKTYKMATSILLKLLTLKCDISRTIWLIEISDGSVFCISRALSFELNLIFDRTYPLRDVDCTSVRMNRSVAWFRHFFLCIFQDFFRTFQGQN